MEYACDDCIHYNVLCKLGILLDGKREKCEYQEKTRTDTIKNKYIVPCYDCVNNKGDKNNIICPLVVPPYEPLMCDNHNLPLPPFLNKDVCEEAAKIDFTKTDKTYFGHPRFYEILDELKELHSSKNRDYATQSDPLRNFKESGKQCEGLLSEGNEALKICLVYMQKQFDAAKKLVSEGKSGGVENIATRLKDVAVYAVLGMILFEENFIEK